MLLCLNRTLHKKNTWNSELSRRYESDSTPRTSMPTARISTRVRAVQPECSLRMVAQSCFCHTSPPDSSRRYLAGTPIFSEIWLMALPCRLKFPSGMVICTRSAARNEMTGCFSLPRRFTPMGAMKSCAIFPSSSSRAMVSMTPCRLPSTIRCTLLITNWFNPCCFSTDAGFGITVTSIFLFF